MERHQQASYFQRLIVNPLPFPANPTASEQVLQLALSDVEAHLEKTFDRDAELTAERAAFEHEVMVAEVHSFLVSWQLKQVDARLNSKDVALDTLLQQYVERPKDEVRAVKYTPAEMEGNIDRLVRRMLKRKRD